MPGQADRWLAAVVALTGSAVLGLVSGPASFGPTTAEQVTISPAAHGLFVPNAREDRFDLVLLGGRVIDPESRLDDVRNVGIRDGTIAAVTAAPIAGRDTVDAAGLIVAPGFIDLHAQGQDEENDAVQALDGVTTALKLALGTADVDAWYREREARARINHGVSIGHLRVRMDVMKDPGSYLPSGPAAHRRASPAELAEIRRRIERGLERGALGVGFGLQYTPGASRWEVMEVFRVAATVPETPAFVHLRYMGDRAGASSLAALQEIIAAAALTGTSVHVHHIHSSGLSATEQLLDVIEQARDRGLDISTEVYPYAAGMTSIESAIFDGDWEQVLGVGFDNLEWVATGERLTPETFETYRASGGPVIIHFIPEAALRTALTTAFVTIASGGRLEGGLGHPRSAGTYARVLGRFVRDEGLLTWSEAIARMSWLPAVRLQTRAPGFARKGRIQEGADADLVVFDPEAVQDRATYREPALASAGIRHTLVHGIFVVRDGALVKGVRPGRAVRACVN